MSTGEGVPEKVQVIVQDKANIDREDMDEFEVKITLSDTGNHTNTKSVSRKSVRDKMFMVVLRFHIQRTKDSYLVGILIEIYSPH